MFFTFHLTRVRNEMEYEVSGAKCWPSRLKSLVKWPRRARPGPGPDRGLPGAGARTGRKL